MIDNNELRKALISNIREKEYGNEKEVEKLYKLIEA